jgi:hypothetical protein
MALSIARQRVLLSSQTAVAKKVFELVPIQEAWTAQEIQGALQRATRSSMDFRLLGGCLNTLKDAGLVAEPKPGHFERVKLREANTTMGKTFEPLVPLVLTRPKTASAEMLTELAGRARQLADDLDAAANAINEESEQNAASLKTLAQLQGLLKSLNT